MVEKIDGEEALLITSDMIVEMPSKGNEAKPSKMTFEKNMSVIPLFILLIILVNIISYIFEISTGALLSEQSILRAGALKRDLVLQGEYWRIISAEFLHASGNHLLGNVIFIYILGMATEHAFGTIRTMIIYFFSLITASLLSMSMGTVMSVGASGALFGLMGALLVYFRKNRHQFNIRDGNIGIFIAVIGVIQIIMGFTSSHVDNYAHIGGFLGGGMVALLLRSQPGVNHVQLPRRSYVPKLGILLSCVVISMVWLVMQGHIDLVIAQVNRSFHNDSAAILYSTRSLTKNPSNHHAYIVRGEAYLAAKKYGNAISDVQRYLVENPKELIGYSIMGAIYSSKKEYGSAIQYYSDAIAIQPSPTLYNGRGYNKILMGDYKSSREDFQNAITLDRKFAPGYGNLGLLDAMDGSYESAITQLEKSYELDNSLKVIKELIAALQLEKNNQDQAALTHYQAFINKTKNLEQWQAENQFAMKQLTMIKSKMK